MHRHILIAALASVMLASVPAYAQDTEPLLDGGPPPLQIPKLTKPPAPRVPATSPADTSLKAEQARLARISADLDAREERIAARETALATQEARLSRQLADLDAPRATPPPESDNLPPTPSYARVSYEDARRACTRAGMSEAIDHDFASARYDGAPRLYERQREMRGRMRMDDRSGYLTVDTICQLDANGAVLRFEVLR